MTVFIKGLDLCESFFNEVARPILNTHFPTLRYTAGLLGYGSDVIGYDDRMSADHLWGPRFHLFLPEAEFDSWRGQIASAFAAGFPYQYRGFSANFSKPDWNDNGVRWQEFIQQGPVDPLIEYHTLRSYFEEYLGYTPFTEISTSQWLTFTEHRLLGAASGRIFHDDLGMMKVREKLTYFPQDVWLWMMAAQWKMISEEEAFAGRCGYVGDEVGSRIVAARQVQRIMRLCFLLEKRYAPYSKWFGSAFKKLEIAPILLPILEQTLAASDWRKRGHYLGQAYRIAADKHNALGITEELDSKIGDYFERPFPVLFAGRFAEAIRKTIESAELKQLVPEIGSVSQFTDSTTVFDNVKLYGKLKHLYE